MKVAAIPIPAALGGRLTARVIRREHQSVRGRIIKQEKELRCILRHNRDPSAAVTIDFRFSTDGSKRFRSSLRTWVRTDHDAEFTVAKCRKSAVCSSIGSRLVK